MNINQIAAICHDANRAYCQGIGDMSQATWDQAAKWQQDSAIKGVAFKLRNPDATPEQQHQSWLDEKARDGWVHGELKDADKKTHPCIVPYADLPEAQRIKDYIFVGIVDACAPFWQPAVDDPAP